MNEQQAERLLIVLKAINVNIGLIVFILAFHLAVK